MIKAYLIPNNDISQDYSTQKSFYNKYKLISFVDKDISLLNTIKMENMLTNNCDVIICSPNYCNEIYKELILYGIKKNRIKFYIKNLNRVISNLKLVNYLEKGTLRDYLNVRKFRAIHENRRAFILGNGPSLCINDLNILKDEITFAANKIYLAYDKTSWRPNYYFVEDDLVFTQNYEDIKDNNFSKRFFPLYSQNWKKKITNSIYFDLIYQPNSKDFPSLEPLDSFYWGSTVVYTMIQWAIYMGIKEIYLLGVDFNFEVPRKKSYNNELEKFDLICEGEINHFDKEYRKKGEKWNLPNLDIQIKSFIKIKEYCDTNDIKIYNSSRITSLDVLAKKDFSKLF